MYIVQCSTWVTRQERDLISLEFNNSTEVTLTQLHIYSYMSSEKKKDIQSWTELEVDIAQQKIQLVAHL